MHFAFQTARSRPRKHLTMVTKSNAQRHGMVFWDKIFYEVAKEYPDVTTDKMLVDAMTVRMVQNPKSLDTIVATNLHADILTDLASALAGSIGIAPSSNLDPTRKNPSMFEPIHGSAPDIAGKGIANPVGAFWSAAEMVRWLGEEKAADGLMKAIENVTARGVKTKDLGGSEDTKGVTDAVCKEIEALFGGNCTVPYAISFLAMLSISFKTVPHSKKMAGISALPSTILLPNCLSFSLLSSPILLNPQPLSTHTAFPTTSPLLIGPFSLLSRLFLELSPSTHTCPYGTTIFPFSRLSLAIESSS